MVVLYGAANERGSPRVQTFGIAHTSITLGVNVATMTREQIILYCAAGIASGLLYLLGERPEENYLNRAFPKWPHGKIKDFVAFILYVVAGSFIVVVLAEPNTVRQAVFAGLGWPAVIGVTRRRAHV